MQARASHCEVLKVIATLVTAPQFATFLLASLILAITPGPGVIYVLTQTLRQGRAAGLASVCGIALGNLANAAVAALGLAVVIAASSAAFTLVKFAGAAYLVFLGVQALRSRPRAPATAVCGRMPPARLFRSAFFVALLNPKTALFFAALLPQFIQPGAAALAQTFFLGAVFVALALLTDSAYVFAASTLAVSIRRRSAWQPYGRYVSAATFMGLGVYAALASPRIGK
jgi:threonine/homoserine/homoserine lactone efflux protein